MLGSSDLPWRATSPTNPWDGPRHQASDDSLVLEGHVITRKDRYGFIKPVGMLPSGYVQDNVYFPSHIADIEIGVKVEFVLNETPKDRPGAKLVWVSPSTEQSGNKGQEIPGQVIKCLGHYGFIKSKEMLPSGFTQKDIYFTTDMADVVEGDEVIFTLSPGSQTRPRANRVWSMGGVDTSNLMGGSSGKTKSFATVVRCTPERNKQDRETAVRRKNQNRRLIAAVTRMHEEHGFLRIIGDAAKEIETDIFFPKMWIRSGGIDLISGDEVEFTLSTSKKKQYDWIGRNVKLTRCAPRDGATIVSLITQTFKSVEEETENSDVLLNILNCGAIWEVMGNYKAMHAPTLIEFLCLLLLLEDKSASLLQSFKKVLQVVANSAFCDTQNGTLKIFIQKHWNACDPKVEQVVMGFFHIVLEHLPHKARMVAALTGEMLPENDESQLVYFVYDMFKKVAAANVTDIEDLDWDELPLVPGTTELLLNPFESRCHLSPVKRYEAYGSVEEYMDTYFRLLRHDCFNALCSGIQEYLEGTLDPKSMNIYNEIQPVGMNIMDYGNGIALAVKVNPQNEIEDWEACSNLMFGNLLCFSPSGTFKDPIWATVKKRDAKLLESDQIIWVELIGHCNTMNAISCLASLLEASGRTVLAESPTYYTAYYPVLRALQNIKPQSLAFQEELVHLSEPTPSVCFTELNELPAPEAMDFSQKEAYHQALQHRLSIIQGPPGTGKTYIGIEIVRQILKSESEHLPLLVLTYKNHALDEFLKAVLEFAPNSVVRIGGRSQVPDLDRCNLLELKKNHYRSNEMQRQRQELMAEALTLKKKVEASVRRLEKVKTFSCETLLHGFSAQQIENLLHAKSYKVYNEAGNLLNLKELWNDNKDTIYDDELSAQEKYQTLNEDFRNWMAVAFQKWRPPLQMFQNIMTSEERLSHFLSCQAVTRNAKRDKKEDEDSPEDEMDFQEKQRERLSAFNHYDKALEMTVKFDTKGNESEFPSLVPSAQRLAAEVSVMTIKAIPDLSTLPLYDRALIIQIMLWNHKIEVEKEAASDFTQYKNLQSAIQELEIQHKVLVLKQKHVVGMTITGASIHHLLLQSLKPAVVIVEEAAEVLEPQLIAVLGDWVKHLFLIGDHKQLRPPVVTYNLVRNYNFDLSMMERLIDNHYPYKTLCMQNRMRPEMALLLKDIYPDLQSNMEIVEQNKPPNFIRSSVFFWSHEDEEGRWGNGRSLFNLSEAEKVIRLALLFIQQGYKPSEVTVIAAYQGQVALLRTLYRKAEVDYPEIFENIGADDEEDFEYDSDDEPPEEKPVEKVKIHTIDMYQGDENNIIIVSLVRSNTEGQIGFLKSLNRRCVAQSRAKCGMYFVGNITTLSSKYSPWTHLINSLLEQNLVSHMLPIHCPQHPLTSKIKAVDAEDIPFNGICKKKCWKRMDCQKHYCRKFCQPSHTHYETDCDSEVKFKYDDCDHTGTRACNVPEYRMRCNVPCSMYMGCSIHPCPSQCAPAHSHLQAYCKIPVKFEFSGCGHEGEKMCGELESDLRCESRVIYRRKGCLHLASRPCYQDESVVTCRELCTRKLECGHHCEGLCGEACNPSNCSQCEEIRKVEKKKVRDAEEKEREDAREAARKELKALADNDLDCQTEVLDPAGDTAAEYYEVDDHVRRYVQPKHSWFPEVIKIKKISNKRLYKQWLNARTLMNDPTRAKLKFYNTAGLNMEEIIKDGVKRQSWFEESRFGSGIYFPTDFPNTKATKSSLPQELLLCDVLLGKSMTVEEPKPEMCAFVLNMRGYDSLFAKRAGTAAAVARGDGVESDEYVVYNTAQVLPKYIIEYKARDYYDMIFPSFRPKGLELKCHILKPKRNLDFEDPLDMHYRIAESQFMRLTNRSGSLDKVKSVEYYVNPRLYEKFRRKQRELLFRYPGEEHKPILAFHGTPTSQNIENIVSENFQLDKCVRGVYGMGIYFSEYPDTSMNYSGVLKKMILCQVLPGRPYQLRPGLWSTAMDLEEDRGLQPGYDSHIVGADESGRGQMVVIFNPDQVLPTYVINY